MSDIFERVKKINLPLDEVVVIGSGLLDALDLRRSTDVDLVVSERLFASLRDTNAYNLNHKHDQPYLTKDDYEIWTDWGADLTFEVLAATANTINEVMFVDKEILIKKKLERSLSRDLKDIELLEGRLS